jgi:hypothetical protein
MKLVKHSDIRNGLVIKTGTAVMAINDDESLLVIEYNPRDDSTFCLDINGTPQPYKSAYFPSLDRFHRDYLVVIPGPLRLAIVTFKNILFLASHPNN